MDIAPASRTDGRESASLVAAARVVRERWPIVLGVALACTFAAIALSTTAPDRYTSSASVLVRPSGLASLIDPAAQNSRDPERDLSTALLILQSDAVADRAAAKLGAGTTSGAVQSAVDATVEADADLLNVAATDADPVRAAAIANAVVEQFVAYRRDQDRARIEEGAGLLRAQIDSLAPEAEAQRSQLEDALQRITALRAVSTGDAEPVGRAEPSSAPSSPRPGRDAVLGILLGAVLGLGVAFLVDLFDRRIKTVEDLEDDYGLRALATIPERPRDPASQRERQAVLEPFRILRNALGFLVADPAALRVVLVTSAVPGEGKSTVASGLARVAALAGQRVVLVEADLRRPTFHQQFDLGPDGRGLTSALVGGVPVADLLRPGVAGLHSLSVLPSGPLPPNSAELLRSREMERVLRDLGGLADLVILDAPPLLPVADAQVLLDNAQIDACILVGRVFRTTREEVRRTRAILERHRLASVGLVVNGLPTGDRAYEYYGAEDGLVGVS